MGVNSTKLSAEEIQDIREKTADKLTEKEIKEWYKGMKLERHVFWDTRYDFYTQALPQGIFTCKCKEPTQ